MSTVTHEIAPEDDIILVVENPNAPFAPCPPPASTQLSATTESANALDDADLGYLFPRCPPTDDFNC
jgi:hypothetical protein